MGENIIKKALITGITGSGGSYLAEYIVNNHPEVEVHGLSRWHSTSSNKNIDAIKHNLTLHECDLMDLSATLEVIRTVQPDAIFHIASYANVRASFINPKAVMINNIEGTLNLFEAVRLTGIKPVIQLCSTSEVYGQVDPKHIPIKEDCPIQPVNPYAVSKLAQDYLGLTYFKSYGLPIVRTRMFAYLNPRRTDLFATSFAMQIARIEAGIQKELLHGNLNSTRTLIDVRDAMESYWVATTKGRPGEMYNIGGTTIITVGEFLDVLKKFAKCDIPSRVDPKLLRPTDVTLQIPDVTKFSIETGWKPRYSFEESVKYLLDHCRSEVQKELPR
ncbi:MAG: GDP-mannose 4,6-dehydratase [Nanoarchaeota archaeon]